MGKATILSAIGEGQYSVLVNMGRERIEKELEQIQADLDALAPELVEAEDALMWAQMDLDASVLNLNAMIAEYIALGKKMDEPPEDGPEDPADPDDPNNPASSSLTDELIAAHNAIRSQYGLGSLSGNSELHNAALGHARYMADNDFVGHYGANGSYVGDRATAAGYEWVVVGENCAGGFVGDVNGVMQGWMDSPGHRANILLGEFTEIGVGSVYVPGTTWRHFWVVKFGDR